jgi:hypothetical protein
MMPDGIAFVLTSSNERAEVSGGPISTTVALSRQRNAVGGGTVARD